MTTALKQTTLYSAVDNMASLGVRPMFGNSTFTNNLSIGLRNLCKNVTYSTSSFEYDLVVIGGGSGGLACAKEAADCGKKVAVLDYVAPSPQGTQWGLGGTCVNVGCIPKKLMHQAALLKHSVEDASKYGWDVNIGSDSVINWMTLQEAVSNYVKSLNWGHRVQLKHKNAEYINAKGSYESPNCIKAEFSNGKTRLLSTAFSVIAVGGRPSFPHIPGAKEHAITSDDVFYLKNPPGKTLVIGGSYVALECAGFLTGLGFDTCVMIRSLPLRGFDQQMAKLVVNQMASTGTKILSRCVPTNIEENDGRLLVTWDSERGKQSEHFETVLLAVGRTANTSSLNLANVNVQLDAGSKKVIVNDRDESSAPTIYAIGDVLYKKPELTPVAIQAGKLLSRRLFASSTELMDYEKVPTAVFTPLEYACVGLSEEQAIIKFGDDNLEIFHAFYKPLEFNIPGRSADNCYIKAICLSGKPEKVVGLHFLGPNAGEVVQGFAAAIKCGLTKSILSSTIGIHPTCAEEIVKLRITKGSGADPTVSGC